MRQPVGVAQASTPEHAPRFYWPALDGLRGFAVIAVILFHASSALTPNGFAGVDIFFGLSGFLITALLLREFHLTSRISLRQFYIRRILRLYPALVLTCLAVLALAVLADNLAEGGAAVLAALFYMAHLWIYTGHDAWLLEHTWTLSLEEHYYIVWPTLVSLMAGRRLRWVGITVSILLLLLLASPWILPDGVRAAYERGAPMIYGSIAAAAWWALRSRPVPAYLPWLGNAALVATLGIAFWPRPLPATWLTGVSSLPGILAVVVITSTIGVRKSLTSRALGWAPLVWTGRRAYGLYLYHFPILSVLSHQVDFGSPDWVTAAIGVVVSFVVAGASYRWLERPFLQLKDRFSPVP